MPRFNGNSFIPLRHRIEQVFREHPDDSMTLFDVLVYLPVADRNRRDVRDCLVALTSLSYLKRRRTGNMESYSGTVYRLRTDSGGNDGS
jgi:Ni,Fe-hydrogenase III component G